MGKSAKVHKRSVRPPQNLPYRIKNKQQSLLLFHSIPTAAYYHLLINLPPSRTQQKKRTSNAGTSTTPTPAVQAAASVASAAKKKDKLNKRAKLRSGSSTGGHGHVLGGADYVDMMMGSRRREREEALKLPRDTQ
jgi:hypothetical protein